MAETNKKIAEAEREKLISFLQDKSLKMIFHTALALEAHDNLKPTLHYNKRFKLYGNRFLKELETITEKNLALLYPDNPEFTTNMLSQMEQFIDKASMVQFADYPLLNKMMDAFLEDKEHWRENLTMEFNRLDADLKE